MALDDDRYVELLKAVGEIQNTLTGLVVEVKQWNREIRDLKNNVAAWREDVDTRLRALEFAKPTCIKHTLIESLIEDVEYLKSYVSAQRGAWKVGRGVIDVLKAIGLLLLGALMNYIMMRGGGSQ